MLNISNGIIARPHKVVIYGAEGVGKTTLAAAFPNPLFIDTEGGTSHMDVRRISKPHSWDEFISVLNEVAGTSGLCETLVIDTADWAEQMAVTHLLTKYKKAGIEEFGYGKGYVYLSEEFSRMLAALDKCIASGIHVVVTAHAKMRKFEQPDEMGAYDRWEMKLSKNSAPLLKEWADLLLFCNYLTFVVTAENKAQKRTRWQTCHVHQPSSLLGCEEQGLIAGRAGFGLQPHCAPVYQRNACSTSRSGSISRRYRS